MASLPVNCKNKGFGVAEVLVASVIISVAIFSLLVVFIMANRLNLQSGNSVKASFLAEEGLEAARFLRDGSWNQYIGPMSAGNDYFLFFDPVSAGWTINSADHEVVEGVYFRKLTIEDVYRDVADDITLTGGTLDPDTKKIDLEVAWQVRGATTTIVVSTYLHDIFGN